MKRRLSSLSLVLLLTSSLFCRELTWDWSTINTHNISFPKGFLWGVAWSEYQNSGAFHCPHADWAHADHKFNSGKATDSWVRWQEDLSCAQKLNVKSVRFSIEWSLIEPEEGKFDQSALDHYSLLCDQMIAMGIKPVITLHHFTLPQWFAQKGGFEKRENIDYFVRYCTQVFEVLHHKVSMWCTINEPGPFIFEGYIMGDWPPFNKGKFHLAGRVLRNMLRAHVNVYDICKSIDPKAQIGIVHNITQFDPYYDWEPVEKAICSFFNHIFYKAVLDFFATGILKFKTPTITVEYQNDHAPQTLDFFGLNYYSHVLISPTKAPAYRKGDIPTDMPYGIYAEGLYRAIQEVSALKVPIYITENGISDAKDDRRQLFTERYLYALSKAIADGYDVRGYFYWSLLDNFEWAFSYTQKFGLYNVNLETQERTLRKGSQYFVDVVSRWS